jgi:hypothetical protein
VLNRLGGGGGGPGVKGFGEGEGEGECEGAPGRVFRAIGGGRALGSAWDLAVLDDEWADRRGGRGGGGGFGLGSGESAFLEELLCIRYPMSERGVTSQTSSSEMGGCSLGIDPWYC